MTTAPEGFDGTAARVLDLHARTVEIQTGVAYERRPSELGCVEGCLASAKQAAFYERPESGEGDPLNAAGSVLYYLTRRHGFTDGNKRIGWLAAVDYLACRRLDVRATDDEVCDLRLGVAEGRVERGVVTSWFAAPGRLVPYSG